MPQGALERGPFGSYPGVELPRIGEVEAVEKGALLNRLSLIQPAGGERLPVFQKIAPADRGIEAKDSAPGHKLRGRAAPDRVEQLLQCTLGVGLVQVGPEIAHDAIPGQAALPRPGQQRQQGRSEEHTSELQSQSNLVCRLLL